MDDAPGGADTLAAEPIERGSHMVDLARELLALAGRVRHGTAAFTGSRSQEDETGPGGSASRYRGA